MTTFLRCAVTASFLGHLGHLAYLSRVLPERVVSHVGVNGPDAWSSRESFITTMAVLAITTNLFLIGCPWLIRRLPTSLINLPNKDYWLAPEQRQQTFSDFERFFFLMTFLTLVLFSLILESMARYSHNPQEPSVLLPIGIIGYTLITMIFAFSFQRRFARAG